MSENIFDWLNQIILDFIILKLIILYVNIFRNISWPPTWLVMQMYKPKKQMSINFSLMKHKMVCSILATLKCIDFFSGNPRC